MNGSNKDLWYSSGLQFECLQCGRCCAGPEQGYIWVSRPEIRLIADYLKIPIKELKQKFLRHVGFRMTIVEDSHTHDCAFLRQTGHGRGCAIYEVRPAQCRNWPFWERNLDNPAAWDSAARKCPGVNKGRLYTPEEIQNRAKNNKWWKHILQNSKVTKQRDEQKFKIVAKVSEIYDWIETQLRIRNTDAGKCSACGECCDFGQYDHRLYVTTPEMIYFNEKIGAAGINQIKNGKCCYQINGKCSVYDYRFAGCRIFCCKGDAAFQGELTESAIKKFRALCDEFQIQYRYVDLLEAMKIVKDNDS